MIVFAYASGVRGEQEKRRSRTGEAEQEKNVIQEIHFTAWGGMLVDIKMLYLLVIVFSLCLLKPVEASDLPAPPFVKLWACSVGDQVDHPTFCDSEICFDTRTSLKAIVFGAVDLKTGKILWKKTIGGHHILLKTYEK
ncbi:MAG: hypothetical protein AB2L14_35320 [Candidatus Xenobiia bacterium LiM19]